MDVGPDRTWMADAACHGVNPELFFVEIGGHVDEAVRDLCDSCPVRVDCLNYAIETGSQGYWGGTTERQRYNAVRRAAERARVAKKAKRDPGVETAMQLYMGYLDKHRALIDAEIRRLAPKGYSDGRITRIIAELHGVDRLSADYIRKRRNRIGVQSQWRGNSIPKEEGVA